MLHGLEVLALGCVIVESRFAEILQRPWERKDQTKTKKNTYMRLFKSLIYRLLAWASAKQFLGREQSF